MEDIQQGLRKIGPQFSAVDDKRQRILRMLRNGQIKLEKKNPVRDNILGLKPKRLRKKPSSTRWWRPFFSYELNGILNWGVSMNYVRFMFPIVPMFYFFYVLLPAMYGVVYERQENNFQWESLYPKMGNDRLYYGEHTISRIA